MFNFASLTTWPKSSDTAIKMHNMGKGLAASNTTQTHTYSQKPRDTKKSIALRDGEEEDKDDDEEKEEDKDNVWEVVQARQPLSSPRDPICILAAFKRHFKTDFSCLDLLSPSPKHNF